MSLPKYVRVILLVEWSTNECSEGCGASLECPFCHADYRDWQGCAKRHIVGCELDDSLNEVGLTTQQERDAARKELGI